MSATKPPARLMIVTHISIEPSWLPQVPASLKMKGFAEWLFSATSLTERSVERNSEISAAKAQATSTP